ncbi:hypothetical protein SKAU_G00090810 [Synaphobranchus kaupii]|uniref:C1q domain-containing protein n=1 Tax=Synaphobranchus kaupii TaxID=118154 RepID=A0A9Q1FWG9_SYNKA|nr:hypothetical protein SKAU_G00090810 [Synaphobranchus kaupii]
MWEQQLTGLLLLCLFVTVLGENTNYNWNGPGVSQPTLAGPADACLTDTAACGCCLMKKQMNRMEEYFNMSLSDLQEGLSRAQNMITNIRTSRSAFSVALTNVRRCFGPFREGKIVDYKVIFLNLDNRYNPDDGMFIAPRSGVYVLAVTVYSDAGAPGSSLHACANLRINDVDVANLNDTNMQDQEDSATAVLAQQLSAGDRVYIYLPIDCSLCGDGSHYNTFTGFLLYATD